MNILFRFIGGGTMNMLISLCMIVKNEEAFLQRCLQSVREYVDDIVIVDTGSTDRTKEIAKSFTDKIYDFVWINDFSAARNEALKHATGNWVLVMDADEYMEEKEIRGLREYLSKEQPKSNVIYEITVRNFQGSENNMSINEAQILRVFGNRMGIRYHRPVHEQPMPSNDVATQVLTLPFYILHSGYLNDVMEAKGKHERNLSIFEEMKAKSNLSPYDHCMIGNQLTMMRRDEEALHHLNIALKLGNMKASWYKHNLFAILEIHFRLGQHLEAWNLIEQYMTEYILYPDIKCVRGISLMMLGFRERAKQEFLAAIEEAKRRLAENMQDVTITSPDLGLRMPLWQLAVVFEKESNYEQSVYYLTQLLMANDKDMEALIKMVEILSLKESAQSIIAFLDKLLRVNGDPVKVVMIGKIAISLGNRELAQHYVHHSPSASHYSLGERLRYALLTNDSFEFERILKATQPSERDEPSVLKVITWGSIVWSRTDWITPVINALGDETNSFLRFAATVHRNEAAPEQDSLFEKTAFETLSPLYILRQWDTFDQLIDTYSSAGLINKLANFFWSKHFKEPAMQYYQHLLDTDQLNADSCENLGFLQCIDGYTEDALAFWEKAIQLKPNSPRLYIQYCIYCKDPELKNSMKKRLLELYPEYDKLALLRNI